MNIRVNLNLIPLNKQINVIVLSKVIKDLVLLEHECGISQAFISDILNHEEEIFTRWRNASRCSKKDETYKNEKESYECIVIDSLLFEWTKRKMINLQDTVQPSEIELQANVIKQQLQVPKYSIGLDFWNRDFNFNLSENDSSNQQSLSLDITDILDDIGHSIDLTTYTKFKNILKQNEQPIGDEMSEIATDVKDIDATDEEQLISAYEFRNWEAKKALKADLAENIDEEESGDNQQQCEVLLNVIPKIEEAVKYIDVFTYDHNKDEDAKPMEEEERCNSKFIKNETNPIEESTEDEVIKQEVIDILVEIEEEICAGDMAKVAADYIKSSASSPATSEAEDGALQKRSAHSIQNEKSLDIQSTDSIAELVQKYELYKSHQQNLKISKIHSGYQEIPTNDPIETNEKLETMKKEKVEDQVDEIFSKHMLNRDDSDAVDNSDLFSYRENIEYPSNASAVVAIQEEAKENQAMELNDNLKKTIFEHEQTFSSYQENRCDDFATNVGQTTLKNEIPLTPPRLVTNLEIKEEEFYYISKEKDKSTIEFKEALAVPINSNEREPSISPSKKNQIQATLDILLDSITPKETSPKRVKESMQNNKTVDIILENYNDSEDEFIQLIETSSDEEDVVEETVHNDVNLMTQHYTNTHDLGHSNIEKIENSKKNYIKDRRKSINATLSSYETPAVDSPKRLKLNSINQRAICKESEGKKNKTQLNEDYNIIHCVDDESDFEDIEDDEHVIVLAIMSDDEDDIELPKAHEFNINLNTTESESTTEDHLAMQTSSYSVNSNFTIDLVEDATVTEEISIDMDEDSIESLDNSSASCNSIPRQFTIIELPAQEPSTQASSSKHTATKNTCNSNILKTDVEASTYLNKLRKFFVKKKNYEAFKIVVNLQMAFLLPNKDNNSNNLFYGGEV